MLTNIFYHIDEFCKSLNQQILRSKDKHTRSALTLSEIMTIMIYYHYSGYKTFKDYYSKGLQDHLKSAFPNLVSYNRFVELKKTAIVPLSLFLQLNMLNKCTGISLIDSCALAVCHNKRISSHKVFKEMAQRGKTSVGWFYGFKVHFIINHMGEIICFYITPGNVADNNQNVIKTMTTNVFGKVAGDKGYIVNEELFESLYSKGIHLITKIRRNMKNKLLPLENKLLLNKRGIIESTIGILKNSLSMEHTRHRSPLNFLAHLCSTLAAYVFYNNKPAIELCDPAIISD